MSNVFVVDGPPGTGKTTYLSRQCERAADAHGPDAVAIASLTRTAAHEIAGRVDLSDGQVGTLHAHAYRGLDRPEIAETPEYLRQWADEHPSLALTIGSGVRLEDAPPDAEGGRTRGDELHSAVMNHRARLTPREVWTPEQQDYAALWEDFKRQTGTVDFTDLIDRAAAELPAHPAAPKVLLLDEAQDFSRAEMRLALQWARATDTTVIVGDTRQALYGWRGSDPDTLLRLDVASRRILEQSHRVPRAVHALAQRWVSQLPEGPAAYQPTAHDGEARALPVTLRCVDPLLDEIAADLDAGRSVMVLTSCGYMLAPVIAALRDAGLAFHNPHRPTQGAWNPMRAAGRLLAFLRPDRQTWGDGARMWTWHELRQWTEPLRAAGAMRRGAKTRIDEQVRVDRGLHRPDDRQVTVDELLELFDQDTLDRVFRLDTDWWADQIRASQAKAMAYPVEVLRRQGPSALREIPRITVGTIHSVKGGQADSVYVFPDLSRTGMWDGWHPGGAGRDAIVRMIYVGLTRARARVTVLAPSGTEHVPMDLLGGDGTSAPASERWRDVEARLAEMGERSAA